MEQAKKSYTRIKFNEDNINGTPISATEARSVTSDESWDDGSVSSEGVEAPLRKKHYRWVEGVEWDKWGNIIRMCGKAGCQYETGTTCHMRNHKAAKHGINVVWFSCDQDNCDYKAKEACEIKRHKQQVHNIDIIWHQCDSCDFKAKRASHIKGHKQNIHNINVVWHQ